MNKKCRICGYRFKDKDEYICPECFTAREDDISCNSYSNDLHLHDDNDIAQRNSFNGNEYNVNETFDEGKNSFLDQERRDEKRNSFAKKAQNQAESFSSHKMNYNGFSQNSNNFTKNTSSQNSNGNVTNTARPYIYTTGNYKQRRKENRVAVVIVMIIIIIIAIPIILINDVEYDYTSDSEITNVWDSSSNDSTMVLYDYEYNYSVSLNNYSLVPNYTTEMTAEEYDSIKSGINLYEDWYEVSFDFFVDVLNNDNPCAITSVVVKSFDENGNITSTCEPIAKDLPTEKYEFTGYYNGKILCPYGADSQVVTVTIDNGLGVKDYDFEFYLGTLL